MAFNGLNWQTLQLPLAAGLQQGTDVRARPQPFLDIARDVAFDERGGIQTRLPYAGPDSAIFGGGVVRDVRKVVANGDEMVLFTKDSLFSWNETLSKWVLRGAHLAVAVEETPRFVTTGDQIDGDRAELNGTLVFAWTEGAQVFAAALDKTTGSVLVSPTAVSTAIGRPRLVTLATKILLFVEASTTLLTVRAIDPAAPGTAIGGAGTTVLTTDFNLFYDVVRAGTQDLCVGACRRQTTTSYTVFKVTPALAVTTSIKARTCDGPIAVATILDGTQTQIVRSSTNLINGDLLTTSTLADVFTAQAIGTATGVPVNQVAIEFAGTTAHAFWSAKEDTDATVDYRVQTNTVTTGNAVGTQADFGLELGVASRAFQFDGHVYVWLVFAAASQALTGFSAGKALGVRAQLQNTYFLYRDDGLLISRATFDVAGGFAQAQGHLPGVALTSGSTTFSWAGAARRIIELGGNGDQTGYDSRSPRDIVFTFDSNQARRCVRLGQTLYISGGLPMQYDGVQLVELGFQAYPFLLSGSAGGIGAIAGGGAYDYKATLRWVNAQGEQERSTTAIGVEIDIPGGPAEKVAILTVPLHVTRRTAAHGAPAIEWWRTEINPGDDALFFLLTGKDPTVLTGDNAYIANDATAFNSVVLSDNFTDAILATKEENPENGAVLENLAPPGASIIFANDVRVFMLDVAGDPDRGWYSKLRGAGQIAAFHNVLTFDIPRDGGRVTAGWFDDNGVLYVSRETAIYAFTGQGKDNLGQGTTFTLARIISQDVGVVNQESVAMTPLGTILKSEKGWYLLASGALQYVGGPVSDFDAESVLAVSVIETLHEIRILTSARMLVLDYKAATQQAPFGQWGERTIGDGVDATIWNGSHVVLVIDILANVQGTITEIAAGGDNVSGFGYGMDVESAWIKLADLQGATSCRKVEILGEFRTSCLVRLRIAYDYEMDGTTPRYVDDVVHNPTGLQRGNPLQFSHGPKRVKCEAIKVRITAVVSGTIATLAADFNGDGSVALVGGGTWDAGFLGDVSPSLPGDLANRISMTLSFEDGLPMLVDARRDFFWDPDGKIWSPLVNNVGVRVICRGAASPTCAQLEAAIVAAGVGLIELDTPGSSPGAIVDAAAMAGVRIGASHFTGGTFAAPTGEAIKLTGLGLEVGTEPGLFRRLAAAQEV